MNQDEALKQAQREIWNKGPFFQSEMAQYAIQLGFEKGAEWSSKNNDEELRNKAAIAAMQSLILKSKQEFDFIDEALHYYEVTIPNNAVICADALIKKLKHEN